MTPYDFSMLTGIGVGGDPILFDTNMDEWETASGNSMYQSRAATFLYPWKAWESPCVKAKQLRSNIKCIVLKSIQNW